MQRFCLALDLKNDASLIADYEKYHQNVWPEIKKNIADAGVLNLEIYRIENRLFMILEANDNFSFEKKLQMDVMNEKVQEWENLMWKFQQPLPSAKEGEKWILMNKIFELNS